MGLLQLHYRNSIIGYYRFGSGPRLAICFHGYGEDATTFEFLGKCAGDEYSFYAIDLPFHGNTRWNDGPDFMPQDLQRIVEDILHQDNQRPLTSSRQSVASIQQLTIIGFSLGGRMALSLYQALPARAGKLVLLAPDGLKVNFWYWLATQTWMGNKFFAFTMKKPGWFFGFLKLLNKLKLINASIFKFVNHYIGDGEVRRLLYTRWTTLRKIRPDTRRIKKEIKETGIPVRLVYGKHDRIILSSVGEKFRKGIEEQCSVAVIPSGHQVLHEKHAEDILAALLH
jgi:pimeloyl-ACP methyl ester carboxylesterase